MPKDVKHIEWVVEAMQLTEDITATFNALDQLVCNLANLIGNKNEYKILLFEKLLNAMNERNPIPEMIGCSVYCPGVHFFTNNIDVRAFLERLLITEELSRDALANLLKFIKEHRGGFAQELARFLGDDSLCDKHAKSIENFWEGLCDCLDGSELEKFTKQALACFQRGTPIRDMPDDIEGIDEDCDSFDKFIELLEPHPELHHILRIWINLIETDEHDQEDALLRISRSIPDIEEIKFALLDHVTLSLRDGIGDTKDIRNALLNIRLSLDELMLDEAFRQKFEELIENIQAMPLCVERKNAIQYLLVDIQTRTRSINRKRIGNPVMR
jgi:hypothetical protein